MTEQPDPQPEPDTETASKFVITFEASGVVGRGDGPEAEDPPEQDGDES
jgi:hypothetical protein